MLECQLADIRGPSSGQCPLGTIWKRDTHSSLKLSKSHTYTKAIFEADIILHALKPRVKTDTVFYWLVAGQDLSQDISKYVKI